MGGGCTVGIVQNAKYLGCLIDRDGDDKCDAIARVEQASRAFGAVRSCVFKSDIITTRVAESSGVCGCGTIGVVVWL